MSKEIRVAFAGVGNCTSSLIQGLYYYRDVSPDEFVPGLMHSELGGYKVSAIVPVAAFDIDVRKVGKDLAEAIFVPPNCTMNIHQVPPLDVEVQMGPIMDGLPDCLKQFVEPAAAEPVDVAEVLRERQVDVLVNLIPTGSAQAARYYADACLKTGVGFVNGIPELIASDPQYARAAEESGSQLIGDDVKSQVGATILHRTLIKLFEDRGLRVIKSYQLNYGGNTDFVNLAKRGESKEVTKTAALHSLMEHDAEISAGFAFLPVLGDTKIAYISLQGEKWGGAPIKLEAKLDVEDSPNSAGVLVDAIRCCKIARDRGISGVLESASAYFMKHPPRQFTDTQAREMLEEFIAGKRER